MRPSWALAMQGIPGTEDASCTRRWPGGGLPLPVRIRTWRRHPSEPWAHGSPSSPVPSCEDEGEDEDDGPSVRRGLRVQAVTAAA